MRSADRRITWDDALAAVLGYACGTRSLTRTTTPTPERLFPLIDGRTRPFLTAHARGGTDQLWR
jgi:hypothetical protein